MKSKLFAPTLPADCRQRLQRALRSRAAFTVRRAQLLLASADGACAAQIAQRFGCTAATVRNALHAYARLGLACLHPRSCRPHSAHPLLDQRFTEPLKQLLHQSPRLFGHTTSLWTLKLVAQTCHAKGWTPRVLSREAIRQALKRLGLHWRRAKHWITSPDPAYQRKKQARDRLCRLAERHPDWVLGFQDETWWSRLAVPAVNAWEPDGQPLRLHQPEKDSQDKAPKALACYGLLRYDTAELLLRFVQGRPVSQVTEDYLGWVCAQLAAQGKTALLLVWDNASWHVSGRVRDWIKAHNRQVKETGGVRIVACGLPVKSPWLNPIEPKWAHGKRAIVEPERKLAGQEIQERVCGYYHCPLWPPLVQEPKKSKPPKSQKKVA
jgi:transposase